MGCFRRIIIALQTAVSIEYSKCMSVFLPQISGTQSACAVFYYHMWPVRIYHIFPHYLIKGQIFGEIKLSNIKYVFGFLCNKSGTLVKEQGSSNLVQNMVHKWPVLRPRCIGPGRARTQIPLILCNSV